MNFQVPPEYFSQWGSLEANRSWILDRSDPSPFVDWSGQGFTSASDYLLWSDNSCGVACVQSLLQSAGRDVPPKAQIIDALVAVGAYKVQQYSIVGLIYDPCVEWLRSRWDIAGATYPRLTVNDLYDHVAGGSLAIASVSKEILWPDSRPARRGGHLVLIFGAKSGYFIFHNPSGLAREDAENGVESARGATLSVSQFECFFAERAMIFPCGGLPGSPHPARWHPGKAACYSAPVARATPSGDGEPVSVA